MADKIDLKQIKPARGGVKLKSKAPKVREKPKQEKPKIIQNVKPNIPNEQIAPPTEDAVKFITNLQNAKKELIGVMREFGKLLNVKTLKINKTDKEKEREAIMIDNLIRAAIAVDNINPEEGEGVLSLSIYAVRLSLLLRDAGNELAYEHKKLKDRVVVLEKIL